MNIRVVFRTAVAGAWLALAAAADGHAGQSRAITWTDLAGGADVFGKMMRKGSGIEGVAGLQGGKVELSGYLLPADREGDLVYSFLLLPVYGGCIHTPPPKDQIVLVTPREPFRAEGIYQSVSVAGEFEIEDEKTQLFVVDGVTVVESGYAISAATVSPSDFRGEAVPGADNPWRRLQKP